MQNTPDTTRMTPIAAVQMVSTTDPLINMQRAAQRIGEAADAGARMVLLPEYWSVLGRHETDKLAHAEDPGVGPLQDFMADAARKHNIWLIGGTIPLKSSEPGKVRNTLLTFGPDGVLAARYDKIHLFGLDLGNEHYHEEKTIESGDAIKVVDTPFGRIGLSVCYDLRFPELYRAMKDVNIIVVPAAFTDTTGRAHWETLIRARAIENLSYVIASAQGGYHLSGRETHGNSMIVDPWGVILDRLPRGSGVVISTINPQYQASLRNSLPALKHRTISAI